jgi:BolA protein
MGDVAERIKRKLSAALQPSRLEVLDDSERHAGHRGARPGGETHFTLTVQSEAFTGVSRIERQRLVMRLLADELEGPVHALSIRALAPTEG